MFYGDGRYITTIGETMALITPAGAESLEEADRVRLDIAGAESNVASHLVRLGSRAAWIGRVGDDPLGRLVISLLQRRGVDTSGVVVDPDRPTGVMFKAPGSGVFYYRDNSAGSSLDVSVLDHPLVRGARGLHVSGITPALSPASRALTEEVVSKRSDRPSVSFDVNFRPSLWGKDEADRLLLRMANSADIVFVGLDEAEALWGTTTPREVRSLIQEPPFLIVKNAGIGATEFSTDGMCFSPATQVTVVEPVGAGDAFAAGYLDAWHRGVEARGRLHAGHKRAAAVLNTTTDFDD